MFPARSGLIMPLSVARRLDVLAALIICEGVRIGVRMGTFLMTLSLFDWVEISHQGWRPMSIYKTVLFRPDIGYTSQITSRCKFFSDKATERQPVGKQT